MLTPRLSRAACFLLLSTVLCSCAASCDPNNKAGDAGVKFDAGKSTATGKLSDDMPTPPADAQFTILCRDFPEPTHVQDSRDAQQLLLDTTKMSKWYIVHAADHSTLYYGFYRTIDPRDVKDGTEGQRALDDLNAIRQIHDTQGNRLFSSSLPVGIDTPDPEANPKWDITKTTGYWSIEIASYFNRPDRKQDAVDSVRSLRANGVEAYYYHGPTASSVCIGCWPKESAIEITQEMQNTNADQVQMVTNVPVDPTIVEEYQKRNIQTASTYVDVRDLTLTAARNQWKEHEENGVEIKQMVVDPVTHKETEQIKPSFLFKIPHKDTLDTMTPAPPPTVQAPAQHNDQPGVGHLRSLGD